MASSENDPNVDNNPADAASARPQWHFSGRRGNPVDLAAGQTPNLPPEVQHSLQRIAEERLEREQQDAKARIARARALAEGDAPTGTPASTSGDTAEVAAGFAPEAAPALDTGTPLGAVDSPAPTASISEAAAETSEPPETKKQRSAAPRKLTPAQRKARARAKAKRAKQRAREAKAAAKAKPVKSTSKANPTQSTGGGAISALKRLVGRGAKAHEEQATLAEQQVPLPVVPVDQPAAEVAPEQPLAFPGAAAAEPVSPADPPPAPLRRDEIKQPVPSAASAQRHAPEPDLASADDVTVDPKVTGVSVDQPEDVVELPDIPSELVDAQPLAGPSSALSSETTSEAPAGPTEPEPVAALTPDRDNTSRSSRPRKQPRRSNRDTAPHNEPRQQRRGSSERERVTAVRRPRRERSSSGPAGERAISVKQRELEVRARVLAKTNHLQEIFADFENRTGVAGH